MSQPVSITVLPNGPIKVSNAGSAAFCGAALAVEGDLYLCRCGDSANAPFCDGTHRRKGFQGDAEPREPKEIVVWEGRTVRTRFNPNACMHVFYCKPLKELRAAELAGDDEAATEILRVVASCPSGALGAEVKGDVREPPPVGERPALDIMEGGELRVQAPFVINAPLPEGLDGDRATLCRCGQSKSKPWCDGRHRGRPDFR